MAVGAGDLWLRLYVASDSPDSAVAIANLRALFPEDAGARIEIVDVHRDPARAERDGVLVTPTLVKLAPAPRCRVLGNLRNRAALLRLVGLEPRY